MMERNAFPAAIFAREIKSSAIAFAETIMGLHVSASSLEKLLKNCKDQRIAKTAVYKFATWVEIRNSRRRQDLSIRK